MSQSKTDCTRSGSAGVELAVVELQVVVHERHASTAPAASRRARRPRSSISRPRRRGARSASGRATRRPGAGRSRRDGRASPRPTAAGSTQVEVGDRVDNGEGRCGGRRRRGRPSTAGTPSRITTPVRYSTTTKSDPMTEWSSQNSAARAARGRRRVQRRQHAVLAVHVVGAGRERPERRWPAHDELGVAERRR